MKDSYLINFNLFCQKNKTSLRKILLQKKFTYEEFSSFLRQKSICPPKKEYFEEVLSSITKTEEVVLQPEVKEILPVEQPKEVIEEKPVRKRRRRKKKID